jgi:hypothetical protein
MSSRCRLARLDLGLAVGVEVVEDDSDQSAFEAAQGFGAGVTGGEALAVVGLAESVESDLGDRDAVQGGVELTVTRAGHPDPAGGVA